MKLGIIPSPGDKEAGPPLWNYFLIVIPYSCRSCAGISKHFLCVSRLASRVVNEHVGACGCEITGELLCVWTVLTEVTVDSISWSHQWFQFVNTIRPCELKVLQLNTDSLSVKWNTRGRETSAEHIMKDWWSFKVEARSKRTGVSMVTIQQHGRCLF